MKETLNDTQLKMKFILSWLGYIKLPFLYPNHAFPICGGVFFECKTEQILCLETRKRNIP